MKKFKSKGSGFTLIELLVVIAIIGLLSAIVLAALNGARKKGNDTRVISDVNQARTQIVADAQNGTYPDLTNVTSSSQPTQANLETLDGDATSQGGNIVYVTDGSNPPAAFAIYGQLVSNRNTYFCIDSTGYANPSTSLGGSSCPGGAGAGGGQQQGFFAHALVSDQEGYTYNSYSKFSIGGGDDGFGGDETTFFWSTKGFTSGTNCQLSASGPSDFVSSFNTQEANMLTTPAGTITGIAQSTNFDFSQLTSSDYASYGSQGTSASVTVTCGGMSSTASFTVTQ